MPPRKKALVAPEEKELYLFLAEPDQEKGINENHAHLITKLVSDKVFAESPDQLAIGRLDERSSYNFEEASWEMLKKFNQIASKPAKRSLSDGSELVEKILEACETVGVQALEDSFTAVKLLVFANFSGYVLDADQVEELKNKVETEGVLLTLLFPEEEDAMNERQKQNFRLLKNPPGGPSVNIFVHTYKSCLGRVLNIVSNKPKRSVPWKAVLEIGSGIEIPVKKLILNRKNTLSLKTLVEKQRTSVDGTAVGSKTETSWVESDGTVIDSSQVGNAYVYGDKLVTVADETTYETGEACLQLLVFCPRENILPVYLVGEGTDILFPQDGDERAALKFDALMKALVNTQTVAVVRKVQRKNARLALAVLAPDVERQGLTLTELCFADGISIPHFPKLIKETSSEEDGINEKDALIDELISQKSIGEFNPEYGPVDPKVRIFRDHVTQKIVQGEGKPVIQDNVQLFFNEIRVADDVTEKILNTFPLALKKEPASDRPSGKQVFRKRVQKDNDETEPTGSDKKIKLDEEMNEEEENLPETEQNIDDLMDDL